VCVCVCVEGGWRECSYVIYMSYKGGTMGVEWGTLDCVKEWFCFLWTKVIRSEDMC
jgi:hypothetical protein